ncbi:uncharacterized protein LOC132995739 [Labrus mixtus]|uniref:uncharacterized protein LOC132995739 n=1 Tax=Labrus mixtus TaxID=508554 RepID=UPI0029C0CDFB|nr:uncharacterized protein LOC132995739 [Labrus mixtus]
MKGKMCLFLTLMISLCLGRSLGCRQKIISCKELKSADGFSYLHECSDANQIFVDQNETKIAQYMSGRHKYLHPRMNLNKTSFFTENCTDLRIKCTVPSGRHVEDVCLSYIIRENLPTPVTNDSSENVPPSVSKDLKLVLIIGVAALFLGIIWLCWRYKSCLKKTLWAQMDGNHRAVFKLMQPVIGQRAADQNGRNSMLESVQVQSTDPQADGETPQTQSLDNIYNNGTQPSKVGGIDVPDGASKLRSMHRNLRDDPGGVTDGKEKDIDENRDMQNGRPLVDRGPKEDENERKPLMPSQGDSIARSDMTGEAAALVDKSCPNPDQDVDVKSASNMKKSGVHKY